MYMYIHVHGKYIHVYTHTVLLKKAISYCRGTLFSNVHCAVVTVLVLHVLQRFVFLCDGVLG